MPRAARSALPIHSRLAASLAVLLLCLGGCSSTGGAGASWRGRLHDSLLTEGVDPAEVIIPFDLTPAGRAWLAEQLPAELPSDRLQWLLDRLTSAEGLGLTYERAWTGTADEVLVRRKANCMGFVNLFVALARELGLDAYFVAVEDKPLYGREGDLVLVSDHVAVGSGQGQDMRLLDFTDEPREYKSLRLVADLEAVAKYYSNKGAEMLREGRARDALTWLEKAVEIAPGLASSWVNLGVARRRIGDLTGAEIAYRRAIETDVQALTAYQNLAALLKLRGREEEAGKLLALVDRVGNRNPYSFIALGDWNRDSGRFDEARRYYRRAILLDNQRAEPYAALGELELMTGNTGKARRWLKRALALEPEDARAALLAGKLKNGRAS